MRKSVLQPAPSLQRRQQISGYAVQEERDFLQAITEIQSQQLNVVDQAFLIVSDGLASAISMRWRSAKSVSQQPVSVHDAHQNAETRLIPPLPTKASNQDKDTKVASGQGGRRAVRWAVTKILTQKRLEASQQAVLSMITDLASAKSEIKTSRNGTSRDEKSKLVSKELADESTLSAWAKSYVEMTPARRDVETDFGRFRERVDHRMRCWTATRASKLPLPSVRTPRPRSGMSELLETQSQSLPGSARGNRPLPLLTCKGAEVEEESTRFDDGSLFGAMSNTFCSSGGFESLHTFFSDTSSMSQIFREVVSETSFNQQLQYLRCPLKFQEPHRIEDSPALNSSPEFIYLRICELAGLVPCTEALRKFPKGVGIIDASGQSLSDADVAAVVQTAVQCVALGYPFCELDLSGNRLSDNGLYEVAEILISGSKDCSLPPQLTSSYCQDAMMTIQEVSKTECKDLTKLDLSNNVALKFRREGLLNLFATSLRTLPSLSYLNLSGLPIRGQIAEGLADTLRKTCLQLKSLSLAGCGLGGGDQKDCIAIALLLGHEGLLGEVSFPGLESADFSGNFFGRSGFAAAAFAIEQSRLRRISFAGNVGSFAPGQDAEGCAGSKHRQTWTKEGFLKGVAFFEEEDFKSQCQRRRGSSVPKTRKQLRELSLQHQQHQQLLQQHQKEVHFNPVQLFLEALQENSSVEHLDISNCNVGPDTLLVLLEALQGGSLVQSILLADNPLGELGLRYLVRLLVSEGSNINHITVSGNREAEANAHQVMFSASRPGGIYKLNLRYPHERAVLKTILRLAESLHHQHALQRFLKFDPKMPKPHIRRDPKKSRWFLPTEGPCYVTFSPPLSEATYRRQAAMLKWSQDGPKFASRNSRSVESENESAQSTSSSVRNHGGSRRKLSFAADNKDAEPPSPRSKKMVRMSVVVPDHSEEADQAALKSNTKLSQVHEPGRSRSVKVSMIGLRSTDEDDRDSSPQRQRRKSLFHPNFSSPSEDPVDARPKKWTRSVTATGAIEESRQSITESRKKRFTFSHLALVTGGGITEKLKQYKEEKEKKMTTSRVNPGLAGTPEGDLSEILQLMKLSRPQVTALQFTMLRQLYASLLTVQEQVRFIDAAARELQLNAAHVQELCSANKVPFEDIFASLFPSLMSRRAQLRLLTGIMPMKRDFVMKSVSNLLWFQEGNLTGRYKLDLSKPADHAVADMCLLINAWEVEVSRAAERPDVSQFGHGETLRNEAFNDEPFLYSREWVLPNNGYFRFDISSTRRPPPNAKPIPEVSGMLCCLTKSGLQSKSKLAALRAVSVHVYLNALQIKDLIQSFSTASDSLDRQDAFCILHTRAVDRDILLGPDVLWSPWALAMKRSQQTWGLRDIVASGCSFSEADRAYKALESTPEGPPGDVTSLAILSPDDQVALLKRVGYLHLLNAVRPEVARLHCQLAVYEQRRVVEFLIQLGAQEAHGRVLCWSGSSGRQGTIPASWSEKGVPTHYTDSSIVVSYEVATHPNVQIRQDLAIEYSIGFYLESTNSLVSKLALVI